MAWSKWAMTKDAARPGSTVTSIPLPTPWDIVLPYFPDPPASIVVCTVKYAGCDLIQYIPVQIRAVSF